MLSKEQNELLTRTGPGTAAGELMRCYWQPAALSEELPPDGPPVPLQLFGEELVLFRDQKGQPGLLGLHCSHRGADLSYGRLEDGGLRCLYHGWLYDVNGLCVEQPGEPAGSTFHERIRQPAYPCLEQAGVIFAYLGPGEPPLLPAYEFLSVPEDHIVAGKMFSDCNYLQALDGGLDPAHVAFLHRDLTRGSDPRTFGAAPSQVHAEETDFGVRIYMVRPIDDDQNYVGITYYVLPSINVFMGPFSRAGYSANWFVPIDDTHYWKFTFSFDREKPLERGRRGGTGSDYHPAANQSNRYMQDRSTMATESYSGISSKYGVQAQDACATEGAGPVQDRTLENLGTTDRGIIASRNALWQAINAVQAGQEPAHVVRDPARNHYDDLVVWSEVLPSTVDWRKFWQADATRAAVGVTAS